MSIDPLMVEVPERVHTTRFILRCPRPGDGVALNAAVCDSHALLRDWMPWAQKAPLLEESEAYCRRNHARFALREDLPYFIFEREPGGEESGHGGGAGSQGTEGLLIGATGLHHIDWKVRSFEIGYWRRAGLLGQGIAAEAAQALSRMAFDVLAARRVEVRMDDANLASRKVAERAGFSFEGLLRCDSLNVNGAPRHTRVYSRVRGVEESESSPTRLAPSGA
jgi:ribosomal-protein-serine acetyltransferase